MAQKRHKRDTRTFEELDFAGQARSINAQVTRLQASVRAHLRKASGCGKDETAALLKCLGQIARMMDRLTK
jgi:hypothetical protein